MSRPTDLKPKRWRDFYSDAFREGGDGMLWHLKVSIAITVCLNRLLEIPAEAVSERKEISVALDDLKILSRLHRKYN